MANVYGNLTVNRDLTVGRNVSVDGTITSTISTGTAPLTITSTTLVSNLNSDKLDSQDGSYYNDLANATGTLAASKGGSGLTSIGSANQVLGVNSGASALEYKTVSAGSGITVTHGTNSITIANTQAGGTVTSVGLSLPNEITVTNSPVTTSGTLTGSWADQTTNKVFAAPNGSTGTPTFRALVSTDIPSITASKVSDFDTQVRTSRLDQMTAPTSSVSLNSQKITNVADPLVGTDAANKQYVDAIKQGLDIKDSVRVATTGSDITLSGGAPDTLDGKTLVLNNRILVKDQGTASQNGLYYVSTLGTGVNGTWTRTTDADASSEVTSGMFTFIEEGSANGGRGFVLTTSNPITLNSTGLTFTQFSGAGTFTNGTGLSLTNGQFSITNTITASGPTGSSSVVPIITYNAQGQLTTVSTATITPSSISAVPTTRSIITSSTMLTGGGDLTADRTLNLASIANNTVIGNVSGSSATPIALSQAQLQTLVGVGRYNTSQFTSSDSAWVSGTGGDTGYYVMTISGATHGRGNFPIVQLMQGAASPYVVAQAEKVRITTTTGNIDILVPSTPDCRFAGIVIVS